jgi:PAS domain S-box-containing protein
MGAPSLNALLRDTCAALAAASGYAGTIELQPSSISSVAPSREATLIALIVAEAVNNAIKYSHPAGVPGKILVACSQDQTGAISVAVIDDGVGLPEQFDPVSQGGRGLGLMRALSEEIGAALAFKSTPLGLTVKLRVPLRQEARHGAPNPLPPMNGAGHNNISAQLSGGLRALEALPAAVYATDAAGRIIFYNEAASRLWGCRPELGKSEFCGSWKLYWPDGTPLPHAECPMALALRQRQPVRGLEAVAERPDGTRVPFLPYPSPLFDEHGRIVGAINMLVDISERKQIEFALARHRDEQAALFRFTDKLFRSNSPADACAAALDAIEQALRCHRSSVLLLDEAGAMRFVVAHGLSQSYRDAVEGHSPWPPEAKDPEPICLEDVGQNDLPEALKAIVRQEGIGALAFFPLTAGGKLIGKFMAYYDEPHTFTPAELELALTIARQLAFGIQHLREAQASRLLASIVSTSDDAIISKDLSGIVTSWNRGAQQLFGYTAEEMVGKRVTQLIPTLDEAEEARILARLRRGERIEHYETVRQRKDGSTVHLSLSISPIMDGAGTVIGAAKIGRDITERKEAAARQELLTREIQHRTKNLFAVVESVVARSFAGKQTVKDAEAAVRDRLRSLAHTHVLLMDKEWQGAELAEVVHMEMAPYGDRVTIQGPAVALSAKAAQDFALAVHELATNAAKYGALSNRTGRVRIRWVASRSSKNGFIFSWEEQGGPPVSPPSQKGFGSVVLEQVMADYVAERPRIDFAPDGVRYQIGVELGRSGA